MQTITPQLATMLASAFRAPRVYIWAQIPLITNSALNTVDASKLGSQLIIDKIVSFRRLSILDIGADSMDFTIDNFSGDYTPIGTNAKFGRYFSTGAIDIKYQAWTGLMLNGAETILPKGVYVSENVSQARQAGTNMLTVNTLDQFSTFRGDAYTAFPPRLYGSQTSSYYNPNYALNNPSGDNKTFVSDTLNWMTAPAQSALWGSDYVTVAVYVSTVAGGVTPVPNSGATTYAIDYVNGKITFTTAQSAGAVVSVDARPLAMMPEQALKHLFVDFGSWDPNFLKIDNTGVAVPIFELARDRPLIDIAKDIAFLVSTRGIRWRLYIDENGYIRFTESATDMPPVKYLTDYRDILSMSPEFSVRDMQNVVRAVSTTAGSQPVTSISYDVRSISIYGQKPTYDIPAQFLNTIMGMDSGTAMAYMNGLTSSVLFEYSSPSLAMDIKILPDISLQVGDAIYIIEGLTGVDNQYTIKQITTDISGGDIQQTLRVERNNMSQDFQFGLAANIGAPQATNPNAIQAQSGLISRVSLNGTNLVQNGSPVLDSANQPLVYDWTGQSLAIQIDIVPPTGTNLYIWRWMYISADAYTTSGVVTGNGSAMGFSPPSGNWAQDIAGALTGLFGQETRPYDVRANVDTPIARKHYRPLLRPADWGTNDGQTAYTTSQTLSSTWSLGPGMTGAANVYGGLRIGVNDYFGNVSAGFKGQAIWGPATPAATVLNASSTVKYGVDFGGTLGSGAVWYGINRKKTPCYLGILVATTNGTMQLKRIPFRLTL